MHSKRLAATVAAGVLVMSGLATGTANAATAPTVTAAPECGKVTLTVPAEVQVTPPATSVKDAARIAALHLVYQVDRQRPQSVLVTPDRDTVKVVRFQEDSGVHWVRYRLSDSRQWSDRVRVESDCRPNFKRADAPSVVQPECDAAKGKLVIPSDRGVTYKVRTATRDYRTVRAGEYDVRPGVYRVTAHAKPGVRLVGVDRWRLEVEAAEACPTPTPTVTVTEEPTETPTPDPTDTPTEEPEPEPQPTVTETNTRVIVINDTRVPVRVDTGLGGLAK